jgi:hypothetical protein
MVSRPRGKREGWKRVRERQRREGRNLHEECVHDTPTLLEKVHLEESLTLTRLNLAMEALLDESHELLLSEKHKPISSLVHRRGGATLEL